MESFAPWYRDIIIVTNGQIPNWLSLEHTRIRLISHQEIFVDKKHLPTYNSLAIESHLHRIPGLSKKFVYFNDDVALLQPTCYSDFYTDKYQVYLKAAINRYGLDKLYKVKCTCESKLLYNGKCDQVCNTVECLWDRNQDYNLVEIKITKDITPM